MLENDTLDFLAPKSNEDYYTELEMILNSENKAREDLEKEKENNRITRLLHGEKVKFV